MRSEPIMLILFICLTGISAPAKAHCEIPCGIYGDDLRFALLDEHITTIEKSAKTIISLSKKAKPNYNQIVRWVTNKETHATKFQEIISNYFLHQRVKPVESSHAEEYKKYILQLTLAHQLLITAMITKQSTDLSTVAKLRKLLGEFRKAYQ